MSSPGRMVGAFSARSLPFSCQPFCCGDVSLTLPLLAFIHLGTTWQPHVKKVRTPFCQRPQQLCLMFLKRPQINPGKELIFLGSQWGGGRGHALLQFHFAHKSNWILYVVSEGEDSLVLGRWAEPCSVLFGYLLISNIQFSMDWAGVYHHFFGGWRCGLSKSWWPPGRVLGRSPYYIYSCCPKWGD